MPTSFLYQNSLGFFLGGAGGRFFAFYRPNGYVIHGWDFWPEMGHSFYRFSWSNSMYDVLALWNRGEGKKCPRDLVLALGPGV